MSTKVNIKEILTKQPIKSHTPIFRGVIIFILLLSFIAGSYYSYQGFFIEVLSVLAIIFFLSGVVLVFVFLLSKELFLTIIGKRSEYNKVLKASRILSISALRAAIKFIPIGLSHEEKERLKGDVPIYIQMRFMQTINNFIMRIFIGAFATAFALLGTIVLMKQNEKIDIQNEKIDVQNEKMNVQNHLMEAERRSSLVFLMSNILDKVDDEIKEQQRKIEASNLIFTDSTEYSLSKSLIGRIIALSRAFKPYHIMQDNTLSNIPSSPERGQLFIALLQNKFDSTTQNTIVEEGNFQNAIINNIDLSNAKFIRANLQGAQLRLVNFSKANLVEINLSEAFLPDANLSGANLSNARLYNVDLVSTKLLKTQLNGALLIDADLRDAKFLDANLYEANLNNSNLRDADFSGANLSFADFTGADLTNANFTGADLTGTIFSSTNFSNTIIEYKQLINVMALCQCTNLDLEIKKKIEKLKPDLIKEVCPKQFHWSSEGQ